MTRKDIRSVVASGTITPAQTRKMMMEMITATIRMVGSGEAVDLTPLLRQEAPAQETEDRLREALVGAHGLGFFEQTNDRYRFVYHWPSFFSRGFSHPHTMQTRVLWAFQALIRRRSPLLFSLLRRKLITETGSFDISKGGPDGVFPEEEYKDIIPVNANEVVLYNKVADQFCRMQNLGEICRMTFMRTLRSVGLGLRNQYNMLAVWKNSLPFKSPLLSETSLMPRHLLVELREILQAGREIDPPDFPVRVFGFGAVTWSSSMFDILSIPHFAHEDGLFGVRKRPSPGDRPENYMLVNLPIFIKQLAREDMFSWAGRYFRDFSDTMSEDDIRDKVYDQWVTQFPLLTHVSGERIGYESIWPKARRGDVYAIPVDAFETYRKVSHQMSYVRSNVKEKTTRTRVVGKTTVLKGIVQMVLGPIAEAGGAMFMLRATHRLREVYISPGWEADFEESFFAQRNYTNRGGELRLLDGVIRNAKTGEYYY